MSSDSTNTESTSLLLNYYRIVLSYSDFKHAWLCAQRLLQFGDDYNPEMATLVTALYCSMVVSYARPFNSGGNSNIGKVPGLTSEVLSSLTKEEKEIHNYILLCRNKLIAHTDAQFLDLEPVIATDMPDNLVVPLKKDALASFTESYTNEVEKLCEKLLTWVVEERATIEPKVLPLLRQSTWTEIHGISE